MHEITCWACGNKWEFSPPMGRSESCERCGWDARVCKNCRFYDIHAYRECLEEQAELVKDKDKRNFCSYFESKSQAQTSSHSENANPLDKLFGGPSSDSKPKSKIEQDLEDFFKK